MFQPVTTKDFPAMEQDTLRFWRENDQFDKLRRKLAGRPTWSFLDGPITANNPMGAHHAWGRTYKDVYQRYKAMQGFDQRWQNGFDCQGLWVEVNVEKELGFTSKKDIEAYGLDKFVRLCKSRVLYFAGVQTQQSIRLGMNMDWNDPQVLDMLSRKIVETPQERITLRGPLGLVTNTVEQMVLVHAACPSGLTQYVVLGPLRSGRSGKAAMELLSPGVASRARVRANVKIICFFIVRPLFNSMRCERQPGRGGELAARHTSARFKAINTSAAPAADTRTCRSASPARCRSGKMCRPASRRA